MLQRRTLSPTGNRNLTPRSPGPNNIWYYQESLILVIVVEFVPLHVPQIKLCGLSRKRLAKKKKGNLQALHNLRTLILLGSETFI